MRQKKSLRGTFNNLTKEDWHPVSEQVRNWRWNRIRVYDRRTDKIIIGKFHKEQQQR
jgi:hypothetical protein